jgi:TctA family transporter
MIMFRGNPAIFFHRPISMVFLVLAMLVLVSPLFAARRGLGKETVHGKEE